MASSNKPFERILIVMFENQYRSYVMQNAFMEKLSRAGADMTNYFGAFHPSQTNYIASLAGEVCAVTNDTPPAAPLPQQTLVDLLEPANVSWRAYMEAYPNEPWNPIWANATYPADQQPTNEYPTNSDTQLARYFRKHNAFASFHTIQSNKDRWANIVDENAFWQDVNNNMLPQYSWFTPDIWNDGHYLYNTHTDTNPRTMLVPQMAGWLEYVFFGNIAASNVQGAGQSGQTNIGLNLDIDLVLTDPKKAYAQSYIPAGTLVVVTFDEADFDATGYDTNYDGPNQIYTVLLGDMIEPGSSFSTPYNHYSLIKTIEKNFGLGDLGKNDREANWLRNLWNESFAWDGIEKSGITSGNALAVASWQNDWWMVFDNGKGALMTTVLRSGQWSNPEPTGFTTQGPIAAAVCNDVLQLVFTGTNGALQTASCASTGWSASTALDAITSGSIALTAYEDYADSSSEKMMLCWQAANGFINSMSYDGKAWSQTPVSVGQLTDGAMALAQFGPSLFLTYKERNTRQMRVTSYNTAPFNAFKALAFNDTPDPANDTSLHQWSPADWPIGNFARKMAAVQNQYQSLGPMAMASIEGEMHLVHRQGYPDTPNANSTVFGLTGIFTASNQETNGYATLDQAGWTVEETFANVTLDATGGMAMASNGTQLLLAWQAKGGNAVQYRLGSYRSSGVAVGTSTATKSVV